MAFWNILLLAYAGGLILNVMPCVLPVLALKALSVLDHARAEPRMQRMHGLAYTLGTVSALAAFGVVIVLLRSLGHALGWGMQFQHPQFVATLIAVVFAFALNALGVFEITFGMSSKEHDGLMGSVVNGWLAAVMGTPCSAPFLGTAAAFAMAATTPAWQTLLIFALIGAGLGTPFALLSWIPALARRLPRPGAWMETVKVFMGFFLLGTAVWLYRVLLKQVSSDAAAAFLAFLILLAAGLWAQQRWGGLNVSTARRWGVRAATLLIVAAGASMLTLEPRKVLAAAPTECRAEAAEGAAGSKEHRIAWVSFSPKCVQSLIDTGRPVFMDFTADWCVACKTLEAAVLETAPVREALERTGATAVRVDMTDSDDAKDEWLKKMDRSALPTTVVLTRASKDVLPVAVTAGQIVSALEKAAQADGAAAGLQ